MDKLREADATLLFEAVRKGDEDEVVRLLRAGVGAGSVDDEGRTALYHAALADRPGIVRLLLASGADPDLLCGPDADDLPLCAAAVGGHTAAVRALLAAGARPDRQEGFGFTAMAWATQLGHTGVVEALLEYGADPNLAHGDVPPLVLAARRGSLGSVQALLRHGATDRSEALAEARRWLGADVEAELRQGLLEQYGGDPAYTTVTRRVEECGGVTVVVEVLRDGEPLAGNEQQTGHGAIATVLERETGIQTPYEELASRALSLGDPGVDCWTESVDTLWQRGDEETFQAAVAWCASDDPLRQAFGVDVLAQLGMLGGERPFAARALPVLRELARETRVRELTESVVAALGHQRDPSAIPDILRHADHPDAEVRMRVAVALAGLVPGDGVEAIEALVALTRDGDTSVRDWATMALAGVDADTPLIRAALAERLDDRHADTVAEAARGLAMRQDPRAVDALARILSDGEPEGYARDTALEAVSHLADAKVRRWLEWTLPRIGRSY